MTQDLEFWQPLETVDSFSKLILNFVSDAVITGTLL